MAPLSAETASANALDALVLRRGTAAHPDLESLSAALDELYGGAIEPMVRKKGETQCVGFAASFLDDAYALEGEPVLEGAAALLGELLLRPRTAGRDVFDPGLCGGGAGQPGGPHPGPGERQAVPTTLPAPHPAHDVPGRGLRGGQSWGTRGTAAAVTRQRPVGSGIRSCCPRPGDGGVLLRLRRPGPGGGRPVAPPWPACPGQRGAGRRRTVRCASTAGPEPRLVEERMGRDPGQAGPGLPHRGAAPAGSRGLPRPRRDVQRHLRGDHLCPSCFLNVREKRSLCYYASSALEKMKGLVLVSSGHRVWPVPARPGTRILAQLEAVRRGEIEDWELEGARRHPHRGATWSTLDDQGRLEEFWLGQTAAGLDTGIEELVEGLKAVTREQVAAAAQKLELDTVYFLNGKEG